MATAMGPREAAMETRASITVPGALRGSPTPSAAMATAMIFMRDATVARAVRTEPAGAFSTAVMAAALRITESAMKAKAVATVPAGARTQQGPSSPRQAQTAELDSTQAGYE
eukprot:CAMPEP_0168393198 /NCGR_PEP_ID=MMETSP0228-20121227/18893_1 /TAXON_ID=133427 /ORGANISM="Protoceratium reticulatum, Strain CCCM 535 (=CCMP 1889)" /LENGTH=111 /DNA_ID=CAMNT_0008406569 /DNA_START=38 /DNA_END=373 /DNA_ORIENTATION=+